MDASASSSSSSSRRYLLTGDNQPGVLSIYDLQQQQTTTASHQSTLLPLQQAWPQRNRSIVSCRWYPTDTGMFFAAARSGTFQIWDTNEMEPVLECRPFQYDHGGSPGLCCMEVSPNKSAAVGSPTCRLVKLIDVRTGASSHSLSGHSNKGVCDLAWSTACPHVLASAGMDGRVILWDVRKATGCLQVLDADQRADSYVSQPYYPDLRHLRRRRRRQVKQPQHYTTTTTTTRLPLAHSGACVGVAFDPTGHFLVSAGGNGDLRVWDLRSSSACQIPRRFMSSRGAKPVDPSYLGRVPLVLQGDAIWTRRGPDLCSYSLQQGGAPQNVLKGHMGAVATIAEIGTGQLVSSSSDGLLLLWGPASGSKSTKSSRLGKRRIDKDQDDW